MLAVAAREPILALDVAQVCMARGIIWEELLELEYGQAFES